MKIPVAVAGKGNMIFAKNNGWLFRLTKKECFEKHVCPGCQAPIFLHEFFHGGEK